MQAGGTMMSLQDYDLSNVPAAIPTDLQQLSLSNCSNLQCLPALLSNVPSLGHLSISSGSISSLPTLTHTSLTYLNLSSCPALETLPDDVPKALPQLQHLNLSGAESLQHLPESLGDLDQLKTLDLTDCSSLADLPDSIGDLTNLTALHLVNCTSLVKLPNYAGNLTTLEILDLSGSATLADLPRSLSRLKALRTLDLSGCSSLEFVPDKVLELPGLTVRLEGCTRLEQIMEEMLQPDQGESSRHNFLPFCVEAATPAPGVTTRRSAAAGAADSTDAGEYLLSGSNDTEAGNSCDHPGVSKKREISQLQRRCRRVYRLVHYQSYFLRPLRRLVWVLAAVLVTAVVLPVVLQLHVHVPDIWRALTYDTDSSWAVDSSSNSTDVSTILGYNDVKNYAYYNDYNFPQPWNNQTMQNLLVEVFPGVKRYKIVHLLYALPVAIRAFVACIITSAVIAVSGLVWIAVAFRFHNRQQQQQEHRQLSPEATAGRFWLLLVFSWASACTAVPACYCAAMICMTERIWGTDVRMSTQYDTPLIAYLALIVWMSMPGMSVLGLGVLWIVENMGRHYPGWEAIKAGVCRRSCY